MPWADNYIEALKRGESVEFRPRGKSMEPLVRDGELVRVEPYSALEQVEIDGVLTWQSKPVARRHPQVGDIVLVTVGKRQYLHLIKAIRCVCGNAHAIDNIHIGEYQIGNNRGGVNGWVARESIHGRMVR